MPDETDFLQMQALLANDLIRERRKGIGLARELLRGDVQADQVRAALQKIASGDPIGNMRELAQRVLDEDDYRRRPPDPRLRSEAEHMVGARCPNGHIHYFDKRRICPRQSLLDREVVTRDGAELDQIHLACPTCGEKFIIEVDCRGYKDELNNF